MNPLRRVTTWRFYQSRYSRPGSGTNALELACGHQVYQKSSIKIPKRARCMECGRDAPADPVRSGKGLGD